MMSAGRQRPGGKARSTSEQKLPITVTLSHSPDTGLWGHRGLVWGPPGQSSIRRHHSQELSSPNTLTSGRHRLYLRNLGLLALRGLQKAFDLVALFSGGLENYLSQHLPHPPPHVYTHACKHTHARTHAHACTHAHMHASMHTHARTCYHHPGLYVELTGTDPHAVGWGRCPWGSCCPGPPYGARTPQASRPLGSACVFHSLFLSPQRHPLCHKVKLNVQGDPLHLPQNGVEGPGSTPFPHLAGSNDESPPPTGQSRSFPALGTEPLLLCPQKQLDNSATRTSAPPGCRDVGRSTGWASLLEPGPGL